jgi:hypothetical protein
MDEDQIIVVQETEYTSAGKHINPQLTFARENGIKILVGDPYEEIPGETIILPKDPSYLRICELDLNITRKSFIRNSVKHGGINKVTKEDLDFLVEETKTNIEFVKSALDELDIKY